MWEKVKVDHLREWHWNVYITICKVDDQCKFWCMKQGSQSLCTGTTQRDGVGREVGRGLQDGETHVHAWVIHVYVWQ